MPIWTDNTYKFRLCLRVQEIRHSQHIGMPCVHLFSISNVHTMFGGENRLTTCSSNLICSFLLDSFNLASFSASLALLSIACCFAFAACRLSISARRFCAPSGVLRLKVLSSPPNKRWPRFFSSCTLFFRFSRRGSGTSCLGSVFTASGAEGDARTVDGESTLPSDSLGRLGAGAGLGDRGLLVEGDLEASSTGSGRDWLGFVRRSERKGIVNENLLFRVCHFEMTPEIRHCRRRKKFEMKGGGLSNQVRST